jgi:glycosyltransferase involved in cell wall biosynthesis
MQTFRAGASSAVRVIINDYLGHTSPVQLSRALARRGHDVLHLYSADAQTPKADLTRHFDDAATFAIEGLTLKSHSANSFIGRRLQEAKFGRLVAHRAMAFRPHVVVAANNPLDVQRHIQAACRQKNVPFVYWMHEFYSVKFDQMIENRGSVFNLAIGSYYHWLERTLLQRSDAIVPIADDFLAILAQSWDVNERQCMVVHHWAPLDRLAPAAKSNAWSRHAGLADKKVALYTGSLGPMENPLILVELAERLRERSDIYVVLVSEGEGADHVSQEGQARSLSNFRVLPFQPYDAYGDVLASADVLLAMVDERAGVLFVPSKVTSYLCAGRPIVIAAPWQNLTAKSVAESGGRVVPPSDAAAMASAVLAFMDDDNLREETGGRARNYAERVFEIAGITDRFERLLQRLYTGPARAQKHHQNC